MWFKQEMEKKHGFQTKCVFSTETPSPLTIFFVDKEGGGGMLDLALWVKPQIFHPYNLKQVMHLLLHFRKK